MSKTSGLVVDSDERAHHRGADVWLMRGSSLGIHLFIRGPSV